MPLWLWACSCSSKRQVERTATTFPRSWRITNDKTFFNIRATFQVRNKWYKETLIKLTVSNQSKFLEVRKTGSKHGYNLPTSPVVLLNALGFLGFKVVPACGWTSEFFILLIYMQTNIYCTVRTFKFDIYYLFIYTNIYCVFSSTSKVITVSGNHEVGLYVVNQHHHLINAMFSLTFLSFNNSNAFNKRRDSIPMHY